jgi:hypothetical protein
MGEARPMRAISKTKPLIVGERKWRFSFRGNGFEHVTPLWLYPEIDCSSCVDDADDQSGAGQLAYYGDYVQRRYDGIAEHAPNTNRDYSGGRNFLSFCTSPVDAKNWWRLSVRNTRFPAFAKALGWLPSPFQEFAPLRSIITNATT